MGPVLANPYTCVVCGDEDGQNRTYNLVTASLHYLYGLVAVDQVLLLMLYSTTVRIYFEVFYCRSMGLRCV